MSVRWNIFRCPPELRAELSKELAIPSLTIHGDLNDLRCYSEEQAKTNIEAFVEQLEER